MNRREPARKRCPHELCRAAYGLAGNARKLSCRMQWKIRRRGTRGFGRRGPPVTHHSLRSPSTPSEPHGRIDGSGQESRVSWRPLFAPSATRLAASRWGLINAPLRPSPAGFGQLCRIPAPRLRASAPGHFLIVLADAPPRRSGRQVQQTLYVDELTTRRGQDSADSPEVSLDDQLYSHS